MAQGHKTGGRQKGTPNKTTALLKDSILKAGELAGKDFGKDGLVSYLEAQAKLNPGPFMALLGKVLPTQVEGGMNVNFVVSGEPVSEDAWLKQNAAED